MLPTEIREALAAHIEATDAEVRATENREPNRTHLWQAIDATGKALDVAILKFGDQRYEEGIEAGRELEQTKMSGN